MKRKIPIVNAIVMGLVFLGFGSFAQTQIKGKVTGINNEELVGVRESAWLFKALVEG
mgnify:FL=1